MLAKIFLIVSLFLTSSFSLANSEVKIPELVGRAMFEGNIQPTEQQKESLIAALRNLESENKVQMGILVVDSVKPYSIEEFSMMVAEKWKIGQKGVDNGVLMLVATKDRKARLEVGNGLQGSLTDAMTKRIQMEKMIPEFKKGNFIEGIIATVDGIKVATVIEIPVITNALEVKKAKQASEEMSLGTLFLLIFGSIAGVVGMVVYWIVRQSKNKKAEFDDYSRRQKEYASAAHNYRIKKTDTYPRKVEESKPSLSDQQKARKIVEASKSTSTRTRSSSSTSSNFSTKRKSGSSSSSYGYAGYSSNDDSSRRSSSNNSDSGISGGGSYSGGGSSSEW